MRPISLRKEIPTPKIVGKKKRLVAANAKMLSVEVTDVTKPLVGEAHHREGERGTLRGRELLSQCKRWQDSKQEEGRIPRDRHRGQR